MKSNYIYALLVLALCFPLVFSGCGGDKGHLTGIVTLDGEPVSSCSLTFIPVVEDGPSGGGFTDSEGRYNAYISKNYLYLTPGEYMVEIESSADIDAADGEPVDPNALRIPKKYYGKNTELQISVKPGKNTFDFELTSN